MVEPVTRGRIAEILESLPPEQMAPAILALFAPLRARVEELEGLAVAFALDGIEVELAADTLRAVLNREDIRRCDSAACNCGGWHNHGAERLLARVDALESDGLANEQHRAGTIATLRAQLNANCLERDALMLQLAEAERVIAAAEREHAAKAVELYEEDNCSCGEECRHYQAIADAIRAGGAA